LKIKHKRLTLSEIVLNVDGVHLLDFLGKNDAKLNLIKKAYPKVNITSRGNAIKITGDKKDTQDCKAKVELVIRYLKEHESLSEHDLKDMLNGSNPFDNKISSRKNGNAIVHGKEGNPIKPRTVNQKKLVDLSEANDIVFAIGPAGTGKTYTAVALAVRALKNRLVKRIVLTRPAVEAGESLGFLPGDVKEKVDPYLRPLYDALDDMIPLEKLNYFMANRIIEIAPLAFMRGRTLDDAFIILDEAQNATSVQLKMFLTRIGPSAKCVITGDLTQIDLPRNQRSGLFRSLSVLKEIEGIGAVFLTEEDVVRHRLVKSIIKAYKRMDDEDEKTREAARHQRELRNSSKDSEAAD